MNEFPLFKTRTEGITKAFKLDDPAERREYFDAKARNEIEKLQKFLKENTFVAFLMGPKNSGKGTYSKLFAEAVGPEHVRHISIGDIVRSAHNHCEDNKRAEELMGFLKKRYRGFVPLKDAMDALLGRSTTTLLPTELILALVEHEIAHSERKTLFIDGFPRELDQVSYALYFGALMGYRDDPDFFVFIDVPETIIDARMRGRVVCPKCQTPRHPKLLRTKEVGYDKNRKEFYLKCDNPECNGERMGSKEGDDLGIEAIRDRIEADQKVMHTLLKLEGVPKVYLRNAIPVDEAKNYADDYEITPAYHYELEGGKVKVVEKPWIVKDRQGINSYSLLPAPIVLSLIKQTTKVLGL
jgi:adenylate kinase family enzyme